MSNAVLTLFSSMKLFFDNLIFSNSFFFKTFIFIKFDDACDLSRFSLWNLRIAFLKFSKFDHDCHDELMFHSSYDSTYVVLYSMSFRIFRQFIIFNNSHFSCEIFSSFDCIRIEDFEIIICFENEFEDVKCNFHE